MKHASMAHAASCTILYSFSAWACSRLGGVCREGPCNPSPWPSTGAQEMLVELNSDCSLPSHFDLLTAINFSEVPFCCFGICLWERDKDKNGFCPLRSPSGIMNLAGHPLAFPFHHVYQEPHNWTAPSLLFFFFFLNEMLDSTFCVIDNGWVLRAHNWTRHSVCIWEVLRLWGEIESNKAVWKGHCLLCYDQTKEAGTDRGGGLGESKRGVSVWLVSWWMSRERRKGVWS